MKRIWIILACVLLGLVLLPQGRTEAARAALPANFSRVELGAGLNQPTALAFAGDEILVTQKTGEIRVVKANGKLRKKNWHKLNVSTEQERGLGGLLVDPKYHKNGAIYVYYTTAPGAQDYAGVPENRVSKLKPRKTGGIKEKILFDHIPATTKVHNGGDLHFGFDGKLYISVGDSNCCPQAPQALDNLRGKILRLNKDGTIPTDNPFYNTAGARQEVYAFGFRNPWRLAERASNQTFLVADVGAHNWEEISSLEAGGNYGWRRFEGPCPVTELDCDPDTVDYEDTIKPIHWYHHDIGAGQINSVAGGVFAENSNYPAPYADAYFYADSGQGWVRVLTLDASNQLTEEHPFDEGLDFPVSFARGPDGNVYVVGLGGVITSTCIPHSGAFAAQSTGWL